MPKASGRVNLVKDEKLLPTTSPFDKEKDRSAGTAGSYKKRVITCEKSATCNATKTDVQ